MSGGDHQLGATKAPDPCASPPFDRGDVGWPSRSRALAYGGAPGVAAANSSTTAAAGLVRSRKRSVPRTVPSRARTEMSALGRGPQWEESTSSSSRPGRRRSARRSGWTPRSTRRRPSAGRSTCTTPSWIPPTTRRSYARRSRPTSTASSSVRSTARTCKLAAAGGERRGHRGRRRRSSFDCNDPHGGGAKKGLFSAEINFGPRQSRSQALRGAYGADQANYIIAKSKNRARIIALQRSGVHDALLHRPRVPAKRSSKSRRVEDREHARRHHRRLHRRTARPEDPGRAARATRRPPGSRARSPTPPRSASCPRSAPIPTRST